MQIFNSQPKHIRGLLSFSQKNDRYIFSIYGTPRVILERPYGGRLPGYHRLDVSLERSIEFPIVRLNLQAGAVNIYDQVNMFYYEVYTQRRIDQMPVAPYISIKLETL